MQVRLLGPVDVTVAGGVRPVSGLRRKAVLAALALHPGQVVSVDRLVDIVWGDSPPPTAVNTVQSHISHLRQVLGNKAAIKSLQPGYVLRALDEEGDAASDVEAAERLIRLGVQATDREYRVRQLRAALALWRGRPLADVTGVPWLAEQAERLEQLRLRTAVDLIETRLALGEHVRVLPELEQLAREHPFDEQIHGRLMLALYRGGRQADALAAYRRLRRALSEDLGIDPSQGLRDLESAILRQDVALELRRTPEPPTPTPTGTPQPAGSHQPTGEHQPTGARESAGPNQSSGAQVTNGVYLVNGPHITNGAHLTNGTRLANGTQPANPGQAPPADQTPQISPTPPSGQLAPAGQPLPAGQLPPVPPQPIAAQLPLAVHGFAGRVAEMSTLDEMSTETDSVVVCAISGTAGVGKTALAVHWAHRVASSFPDGQLYVNLRGYDPAGPAMEPAEALRGFLDALGVPALRVPAGLPAQTALYRSTLAGRRVLVVLDNARNVDQVRPLLPGSAGCLVLVTSRDQLTPLVATEGARLVPLERMSPEEGRDLLARRLGGKRLAADSDAVEEIVARCARLPLALAIASARAATNPRLPLSAVAAELRDTAAALGGPGGDPATDLRTVFSWSYRILSPEAARLFRLLGLHGGPDIAPTAAASLAGAPPARARALLSELARAHLVAEDHGGRFSSHDLLRAYAAELAAEHDPAAERDGALRRLLDHYVHSGHAAARLLQPNRDPIDLDPPAPGVTLAALGDADRTGSGRPAADATPNQQAHASDGDGDGDGDATTDQQTGAGEDQAMDWFTAEHHVLLAAVNRAVAAGLDGHALRLVWALADFLDRRGHWRDWGDSLRVALHATRRLADRPGEGYVRRGLGRACAQLDQFDEASGHFRAALSLFGAAGDDAGQALSHLNLAWLFCRQGQPRDAVHHARQALALYRTADHTAGQARALNSLGWYHAQLDEFDLTLSYCRESLSLLRRIGDRRGEANAWDSMGFAHAGLGDHPEATECYRRAVELFRQTGDRYYEADTLAHLGDAHAVAGLAGDAWRCRTQALAILDELGHPDAAHVRDLLATPAVIGAGYL